MTREEYKQMKEVGRIIAPFFHPSSSIDGRDPAFRDDIGNSVRKLREEVRSMRTGLVLTDTYNPPIRIDGGIRVHRLTKVRVTRIITGMFATSKTEVSVKIGLEPSGEKIKKEDRPSWSSGPIINFTVGHMWERRVYQEFYSKKNLESDWFVLAATEVKVNRKNQFRLFEAKLFNPNQNVVKDGYVIKTTIGSKKAAVASTANQAVELGYALISEEIKSRINKGETE